jgi:hypothetical protein
MYQVARQTIQEFRDTHRDRSDDIGELSGLIALFPPPVI